jgi:hypothetical protein
MSDEQATRVFRDLQALARADYGANTGALLVVYAVEGFLRRLAASTYATKLTLKGGMLMAAMSARRMTKDADLSAVGVSNDEARVAAIVGEIATLRLDRDDGLVFDATTITTQAAREEAEYQGVRVKLVAHLATARMTVTLDFSFGDPRRSTVIELPELLGQGTIRLASYLPEMTLAEKIATMMSRRELNTRDRDFADVWVLSRVQAIAAPMMRDAIVEVSPATASTTSCRWPKHWPKCPTAKCPTPRCSTAWPISACRRPHGVSCSTTSVPLSTPCWRTQRRASRAGIPRRCSGQRSRRLRGCRFGDVLGAAKICA